MLRKKGRWPRLLRAMAAVTDAIVPSASCWARLAHLRFLVVGISAANREILVEVGPFAYCLRNSSAVKRTRRISGFAGLPYWEIGTYRLLAFPELVSVARR